MTPSSAALVALRAVVILGLATLPRGAAAGESTDGTLEAINGQMEVAVADVRDRNTSGDAIKAEVDRETALVGTTLEIAAAWRDFAEAYDGLVPDDSQFDPDYGPEGSPEVPSACAEGEACQECYEKAVRDINFYQFSLEKGRSLARSTIDYARKAVAFGDSAAGSFGVGGLQWSLKSRPQIEKSVAKLRRTYAGKYGEWIAGLEQSLRALGRCEEEHFGERDWYGRFGFIYWSFMADRYRSPDQT